MLYLISEDWIQVSATFLNPIPFQPVSLLYQKHSVISKETPYVVMTFSEIGNNVIVSDERFFPSRKSLPSPLPPPSPCPTVFLDIGPS